MSAANVKGETRRLARDAARAELFDAGLKTMAEPQQAPILVVEDDPLLRDALGAQVRAQGFIPRLAADRASALAAASECMLAIIDLGLPPHPDSPQEGLLLIETLSLMQPQMPILVLTGQDEARSARASIERGVFDFLAKPVDGAALAQALARAWRFARVCAQLAGEGRAPVILSARETAQGLQEAADLAQEKLLRATLAACGGNVAQTARKLGLPRSQLYYYLDKFGLNRRSDDAV
ncbi:MAG: response regulator [Rhodocyclaceae bacterium]